MREECSMAKQQARRKRRSFTPEFKAEAVRLCRAGDRSITQVANELDLTETALREWVKRADADAGEGSPETLTTGERDELRELRNRCLLAGQPWGTSREDLSRVLGFSTTRWTKPYLVRVTALVEGAGKPDARLGDALVHRLPPEQNAPEER
jgi:transposase